MNRFTRAIWFVLLPLALLLGVVYVVRSTTRSGWSDTDSYVVLAYSTYLGGSGPDKIICSTADAEGNLYVAGSTRSNDYPATPGAYQTKHIAADDVIVAKYDPDGRLAWSTLIADAVQERAHAIAVDDQGYVYICGNGGPAFVTTPGVFQRKYRGYGSRDRFFGSRNAFVAKIRPDGSDLAFSTFSGTGGSHWSLDIDGDGNLVVAFEYVPGSSPARPPASWFAHAYQREPQGGKDIGVMKISADGSKVLWATYFGGSGDESHAATLRVSQDGDIYLFSCTDSDDLPTTLGVHDDRLDGKDYFLARLSSDGSSLVYCTYLGGAGAEFTGRNNLEIDAQGSAYVAAWTESPDFPVTEGVVQPNYAGGADATLTKFSPTGELLASTFYGGSAWDFASGIAVDAEGHVLVTGTTASRDLPVSRDAGQPTNAGRKDAFLAKFSNDLTKLVYATYLGTETDDEAFTTTTDGAGSLFVIGHTWSKHWPTRNAAQGTHGGDRDIIVAKFTVQRRESAE